MTDQPVTVDHGDLLEVLHAAEQLAGQLRRSGKEEVPDRIDRAIMRLRSQAFATARDADFKQMRQDFAEAHAEGLHDDVPREWCPECEATGAVTSGSHHPLTRQSPHD